MWDEHSRCCGFWYSAALVDESEDAFATGHAAFDLFEDTGQFSDGIEGAGEQCVECCQFSDAHRFSRQLDAEDCVSLSEDEIGSGSECGKDSEDSHGF